MSRLWSSPVVLAAVLSAACGSAKGASSADKAVDPAAVPVSTATAVERPITRFIRVTGTLAAEEQADVAAETQGRVVATPVERGTRVAMGADLDPDRGGRSVGAGRGGPGQRGPDREPARDRRGRGIRGRSRARGGQCPRRT